MPRLHFLVPLLILLVGCSDANDLELPVDAGPMAGEDSGVGHSSVPTLSPVACQADLDFVYEKVADDFFTRFSSNPAANLLLELRGVSTASRSGAGVVNLVDESVVIVGEESVPGFGPDAIPGVVVWAGLTGPDSFRVARCWDIFSGPGQSPGNSVGEMVMASSGDVFVVSAFDGFNGSLSVVPASGETALPLFAPGDELQTNTGPQRSLSPRNLFVTSDGEAVATVFIEDGQRATLLFGSNQEHRCLVAESPIECPSGLQLAIGAELEEVAYDADTIAVTTNVGRDLIYSFPGVRQAGVMSAGEDLLGGVVNRFHSVHVCAEREAIYLVADLEHDSLGAFSELIRIDAKGDVFRISNFAELLSRSELTGDVPNVIRRAVFGGNCNALLVTEGEPRPGSTDTYDGLWASYEGHGTVEIVDYTFDRPDNGNGSLQGIVGAWTGSRGHASVGISSSGGLFFATRMQKEGTEYDRYFRATVPGCLTEN